MQRSYKGDMERKDKKGNRERRGTAKNKKDCQTTNGSNKKDTNNPETLFLILNSHVKSQSLPFFDDPLSRKMFIHWVSNN